MPFDPLKGHAALRRGRFSQSHATYFLTLCTAARRPGLDSPGNASSIWHQIDTLEADATWSLRCAVLMPDHLHLLVTLGERLTLSQAVSRLKAKTANQLRPHGLGWERGYYDHRFRPEDDEATVFLYIYLNPYRAKLLTPGQIWPHYRCAESDWAWFSTKLDANLPPPAWLSPP